jgi:hypothetical protein
MRFATKFDAWIVAGILAGVVVGLILPTYNWATRHGGSLPWPLLLWLLLAYVLVLIPYDCLTEIRTTTDTRSAGVFSTDRVIVATKEPKTYIIAPAEQERFFDEVARRAPHLERRAGGLALPFSMFSSL